MPFKKGYKPFNTGIKGYTNAGSFKKKTVSWNKGKPTTIPRCKKCASFLSKQEKHQCRSVDLKKNRRCEICNKKLHYKGWERYSKICGRCGKIIQRQKERELKKQLVKKFGGGCKKCGYDKFQECLEFHHLNKKENENKHFLKEVLKHPEKFELLCNRCHREKEVIINRKKRGDRNDTQIKEIKRRALSFR